MNKIIGAASILGLGLFFSAPSFAAIWGASEESDAWEFVFTPYMYSSDLKADVKVNGQPESFKHTNPFDFVTYGIRLRAEAWKGRWGVLGKLHYLSLWDEAHLDSPPTVELNSHFWGLEAAGSYRYLQTTLETPANSDLGLELYLGARAASLNTDLNFSPGEAKSFNKSWLEPIIGHRIIFGFGEQWNFVVKGDIGGFGIGSASKLTWDFSPEVIFLVTDGIYLNAGYEIFDLRTESEKGNAQNEVHARTSGPTLGLTIHFSGE